MGDIRDSRVIGYGERNIGFDFEFSLLIFLSPDIKLWKQEAAEDLQ